MQSLHFIERTYDTAATQDFFLMAVPNELPKKKHKLSKYLRKILGGRQI